jgi:hypothetical protein
MELELNIAHTTSLTCTVLPRENLNDNSGINFSRSPEILLNYSSLMATAHGCKDTPYITSSFITPPNWAPVPDPMYDLYNHGLALIISCSNDKVICFPLLDGLPEYLCNIGILSKSVDITTLPFPEGSSKAFSYGSPSSYESAGSFLPTGSSIVTPLPDPITINTF